MHHHDYFHTPILPQESLSEYGSGWEWDDNVHVFDSSNGFGIPYRLHVGNKYFEEIDYCGDIEKTNGMLLLSNSQMMNQISCKAHTFNLGNYYSQLSIILQYSNVGDKDSEPNSICPKGWTSNVSSNSSEAYFSGSYGYLLELYYDAETKDLFLPPFSFNLSGVYVMGELLERGNWAYYRSTRHFFDYSYFLFITSDLYGIDSGYGVYVSRWGYIRNNEYGFSLRCTFFGVFLRAGNFARRSKPHRTT